MAGKIFYRKRSKIGKKDKKPRFRIVATSEVDVDFYLDHLRKQELEIIANSVGAELISLKVDSKK